MSVQLCANPPSIRRRDGKRRIQVAQLPLSVMLVASHGDPHCAWYNTLPVAAGNSSLSSLSTCPLWLSLPLGFTQLHDGLKPLHTLEIATALWWSWQSWMISTI